MVRGGEGRRGRDRRERVEFRRGLFFHKLPAFTGFNWVFDIGSNVIFSNEFDW